jgi:hypothetical protein
MVAWQHLTLGDAFMDEVGGDLISGTVDRRRFLIRAATIAWSTPVILTLAADRAGAQGACKGLGEKCGSIPSGSTTCTVEAACCSPTDVCRRSGSSRNCTCQRP